MAGGSLDIAHHDRKGRLPRLPFLVMKDTILGKRYDLSIAVVTPSVSRTLNRTRRGKDHSTNVLSFTLSEHSGELVLCPSVIKKEAPKFGMTYEIFFGYLVIHGMLHLKGMEHGSTMEHKEELLKKKFNLVSSLKK